MCILECIPTELLAFEVIKVDGLGHKIQQQQRQSQCFKEYLPNGRILEMVEIPTGSGRIGSPLEELARTMDEPEPQPVAFASFFMGKFPISQTQWAAVASLPQIKHPLAPMPSMCQGPNKPVEQVSWLDAVEFCDRLSVASGRLYRLPTEAEWEYACRAGSTTPFHFGKTLRTDIANYRGVDWSRKNRAGREFFENGRYGRGPKGEYREETTDIGLFKFANAFGLHDLHGNVWEWCTNNTESAQTEVSNERPLRGGSWQSSPKSCRSAARLLLPLTDRKEIAGFRVICTGTQKSAENTDSSQSPSQQTILSNANVGGNVTIGNVHQTVINNTIINGEREPND